ncbi:MAG: spinster family MFS transporter [Gammaproteobacteria bacterium]
MTATSRPPDSRAAAAAETENWPSPAQGWYAIGILLVAFIFSFIDRTIIALLVEPIKQDLGISDFGIGLLQGLAFAIFYALVGIPIGRMADRYSRRGIIAAGIFLWSLMTAACGLAKSFFGLFLARVGVGVGEAALSPSAFSMISDLFPKDKLGRALSVYQAGAFLGAGIAFLAGGAVIQLLSVAGAVDVPMIGVVKPWQMTFFVVGLPGVLVALLMLTVTEPARRGKMAGHDGAVSVRQAFDYVKSNRRLFSALFTGFALLAVPITTFMTWVPAYMNRVHDYSRGEAGFTLGLILLIFSPAGVYFGGWLTDQLQKRGYVDATFRVGMLAAVLMLPLAFFATRLSDSSITVALFCPFVFCASMPIAAAPTTLQLLVPNEMRAQLSAGWMLALNLISTTAGPTLVGFVSAYVLQDDAAVGTAVALVNCISVPIAGLLLWIAVRPYRNALDRSQAG